jgi:hypothetical protein
MSETAARGEDDDERGQSRPRFFLNVDLELESSHDLHPLIRAFEPVAYALERPAGRACFELDSAVDFDDPEPIILEFVRLVNDLPADARIAWDRASRRVFDIGFQSERQPFQQTHRIAPQTLQAVGAIGAELAVTVYALDSADEEEG